MFFTVAHYKGGVCKTTTAVHLAAYLNQFGKTLLIDGDPNRSASSWARRGGFPFQIADETEGAYQARNFDHVVIDTQARPVTADFQALAKGCDLLIIPTVPATLETDALILTLEAAKQYMPSHKYRVLLTKVPPRPEQDGPHLRAALVRKNIPIFESEIPRLKSFERAAAAGILVYDVKFDLNAKRAWRAYESAGEEIINASQQIRQAV